MSRERKRIPDQSPFNRNYSEKIMRARFWVYLLLMTALVTSVGCGRKRCECRQGASFASPGNCCPTTGELLPPTSIPSGF